MTRVWNIDVPGRYGYSFAIKCDAKDEEEAIDYASENDCYDDADDALYAMAEDITDYPDDLKAFQNCTYDLTKNE